jgi:hypothetical protein
MGIGRKSFVALAAAGTTLAAAFAAPAAAAESSGWQYSITPYLYMTSMSGTTKFGPISAPVDLNFGEVLDHLDFAVFGNFNAQNDKWAGNVDLMYAKLSATGPKNGLFNVDIEQGIYAGVLARRIAEHAEVYAGVRIVTLDVGIHSNFGPQIDRSRSVDWVDPIVGLRVNAPVSDKVTFNFMADIGGFGIGADYDIQVWPTLQIKLGQGRWRADVGYRVNYLDYSNDSGIARFQYDMLLYGPTLGVSYTF